MQLRIRIIALENLVISLLAQYPDRQLDQGLKWRLTSRHRRGSLLIL